MPLQLPIFELPLVLLPGEQVPLHIFEERYKRMIGQALDRGEPFGIVLRDADGARPIGCTAHVTEVLERFADGRLNIVITGDGPFRVLDRFGDPEEPAAEVEMLDPGTGGDDAEAREAAREAFRDLAERASGERPEAEAIAIESAYGLASRVELPAETKQELLELRDEDERMRLLARVLVTLQQALDQAEDIAERAQSNGKVRIG
ncbi:MAG: LON peptidase substrate-binding domain-containing protein [Actinomycetota bacterium]